MFKAITVNEKEETISAETLAALFKELGIETDWKVIARNGEIIRNGTDFSTVRIANGDVIDIFLIAQGG